ncbi:hypothetical protein PV10_04038 [Exophiala mesophila]|uniref:Uncharacterized protein n=1 Tax=Exophiala mesophila TaxID=212818 RepID=A0A0D1ZDI1_EXOME|nr:uncharacterized protein PV10_04038 [Exophiala mesophila]KIV92772.1 hypothetical protein PV10_04038 [Exophiala mesophila]
MDSYAAQPARQEAPTAASTFMHSTEKAPMARNSQNLLAKHAMNQVGKRYHGTGNIEPDHGQKDSTKHIVSVMPFSIQLDPTLSIDKLLLKKPNNPLDSTAGHMLVTLQVPTVARTTFTTTYAQVASGSTSIHTCVLELERVTLSEPTDLPTSTRASDYPSATAAGVVMRIFMYELPSLPSQETTATYQSDNIMSDSRQTVSFQGSQVDPSTHHSSGDVASVWNESTSLSAEHGVTSAALTTDTFPFSPTETYNTIATNDIPTSFSSSVIPVSSVTTILGSAISFSPSSSFTDLRQSTISTFSASGTTKSPLTGSSSQKTGAYIVTTSSDTTATTAWTPLQTDAPTNVKSGYGNLIVIPFLLGVIILILASLMLWRKLHRKSFDKFIRRLPLSETCIRLSQTRAKNRKTRQMVEGTYTGDNDGFSDALYSRRMRKHTAEAEKAAMKRDLDMASPSLSTPRASRKASKIWRETKSTTTSSSSGTSHKVPDRAHVASASLASMESWEEKWHALGNETPSRPAINLFTSFHAGESPTNYQRK